MRGFGAISAAIKSSREQSEIAQGAHAGSIEDSNPSPADSPEMVETSAVPLSPPALLPVAGVEPSNLTGSTTVVTTEKPEITGNGNGDGDLQTNQVFSSNTNTTTSFRFDTSGLNSIQPGAGLTSGDEPETLNIPAVLWDRPTGSSKRVPPPVPPRSPRRPYDHSISFAAASDSDSAFFRGD